MPLDQDRMKSLAPHPQRVHELFAEITTWLSRLATSYQALRGFHPTLPDYASRFSELQDLTLQKFEELIENPDVDLFLAAADELDSSRSRFSDELYPMMLVLEEDLDRISAMNRKDACPTPFAGAGSLKVPVNPPSLALGESMHSSDRLTRTHDLSSAEQALSDEVETLWSLQIAILDDIDDQIEVAQDIGVDVHRLETRAEMLRDQLSATFARLRTVGSSDDIWNRAFRRTETLYEELVSFRSWVTSEVLLIAEAAEILDGPPPPRFIQ